MKISKPVFLVISLALAIKIILLAFAVVNAPQSMFQNDSYDYLQTAEVMASRGIFAIQNHDGSYRYEIYRTPGYPLFLAIFHDFLKIPLWGILILQLILTLLTAFIIYRTALIIDPRIAFLSAVIILYDLPVTFFSLIILAETLFLFFISLFLYCFVIYLKNGRIRLLLALAIILAAATYIRPISYYLGIAAAALIIYANIGKGIKRVAIHTLVFLAVVYSAIGAWHYRNYIHFKQPIFTSVASSDFTRFSIFKSYARNKQAQEKKEPPAVYYIKTSYQCLVFLMTSPGTLKDFKSPPLRIAAKIAGYFWMALWMLGFLVGLMKIKYNIYYRAILLFILYFAVISVAGVTFLVEERFRVPMMPFIAIISAYGWAWLLKLKND